MTTYSSIQSYRKDLHNKIKDMRKAGITTTAQAARYMVYQARRLAPQNTGQTVRGIKKRKMKTGHKVESVVPGSFKQNLFANRTAPYRTLRFGKRGGGRVYAPNQNVIYGGAAMSRSGKQIRWTGTPRFFHIATLRSQKYFRKVARKNTRKALRVGVQ